MLRRYQGVMVSIGLLSLSICGCATESPVNEDERVLAARGESLTEAQQNELLCAAMSLTTPGLSTPMERQSFRRGCILFHNETFEGNDRTCSTCHLHEVGNGNPDDNNFDLSPADVEAAFAADPTGPLFRSIDADDGASDFTTLRQHALVRIPLPLHANVTVVDEGSPLISPDGRTATLLRSTPSSENTFFEMNLMWDGRNGDSLEDQALEATITHAAPGRLPTAQELSDIAFFQQNLFTNETLRVYANGGPPPVPPEVPSWLTGDHWDSVRRGRGFFVDDGQEAVDMEHRDLCATCHSGPMLNMTSNSNPLQPEGEFFSNNFSSELNASPLGLGLPEHTFQVVLDHPVYMPEGTLIPIPPGTLLFPPGIVFTTRSSDPGRILTTGDPCEVPLVCLVSSNPALGIFETESFFKMSSLWGVADSGPYFHNHSAETLEDVMEFYLILFGVLADALPAIAGIDGEPFRITDQDRMDMVNYMEWGFRHRPILVP